MSDYDVIVIGAGPAGLQAAIHASRKKVKVCVLGKLNGSALERAEIENYFGVQSMKGKEMLEVGASSAREFGAQLLDEDASFAIDYAIASIEQAKVAVLDAIAGHLEVEKAKRAAA